MNITNSEFILMILIIENKEISGYKMNILIEERGYREWAGIGSTSIYKGLKRLENLGFICSSLDVHKTTKGPIGKKYKITRFGKKQLSEELKSGLSGTKGQNQRFKIALSGIDLLENSVVPDLLENRVLFLNSEYKRLSKMKKLTKHEPLKVQMLFEHSLRAIRSESKFTVYLAEQYKRRDA
jgi:DNA-binding PadR family transcriptional regulator